MERINLNEKFGQFTEQWSPKVIARVNDTLVKLARVEGEFVWHEHEHEDELFLVVKGQLALRFRDREVILGPGEMCVVPRGVQHCPVADKEAWILLMEPDTTLNTGNVRNDRTVSDLETI